MSVPSPSIRAERERFMILVIVMMTFAAIAYGSVHITNRVVTSSSPHAR